MLSGPVALSASAAAAQFPTEPQTGSHISVPARARIPDEGVANVDQGRVIMGQFAQCVIGHNAAAVERAQALPLGPEYNKALSRVITDDCLESGTMRFKTPALRGPLFSEMYRARYRANDPGLAADAPDFAPAAGVDVTGVAQAAILTFADCVVRRNGAAARQIVLPPTASKQQDEALQAIYPDLGRCLPEGQQVKLNKSVLESAFAEVLYREAASSGAASAGRH